MKARSLVQAIVHCVVLSFALQLLAGCQLLGGVEVTPIAQTTNKPSQVAVYVSVRDTDGPVTRLEANDFRLIENETELNASQVGLQLLPSDSVAAQQTLVLVDLSGPINEAGRRELLIKQLTPFVDRLRMQQNTSVYGFDGGEKLYPFGKFDKQTDGKKSTPDLAGIKQHKQADSSSNLHGAILTAISQLDFELNASPKPIKLGRLVIIARGPDLAGRTSLERVEERFDQIDHAVFVLGIEQEPNTGYSEQLGRDGHVTASSFDNMESQLSELATMVEANYNQYYLVSYCSPARAGERLLVLEVDKPEGDGSVSTGSTEVKFSADGFGSGCDASKIPRFAGGQAAAKASKTPSDQPANPSPAETSASETEPAAESEGDEVVPPPASPTYSE